MDEIDTILKIYEPGRPEHKPEVFKQMAEITKQREEMAIQKQQNNQIYEKKLSEQNQLINNLIQENNMMKTKIEYLENKMREIIQKSIAEKKTQS